ncbi:MAG: hypothetical protein AUH78_12280 [Gemmatimonadetes bacterium 13_1_40CM_4_69_8]|nr:MAG: hypothetical protein AUH78_12280 [Gemmatimonadetes bacterium 13_1_40CM_4_69_8]
MVGTPEFMSPEQLSGDKLDGRSDLYSLGLVLFRMLTGKLPFEATSVQETMIKRLTDEPITLAVSRPDLAFPPGLQEVLDAALTRSPLDRYQSAAKFATDVTAVVGTTPGGRDDAGRRRWRDGAVGAAPGTRSGAGRLGHQGDGAREEALAPARPGRGRNRPREWRSGGGGAGGRAQGRWKCRAAGHGPTSGGKGYCNSPSPRQHQGSEHCRGD